MNHRLEWAVGALTAALVVLTGFAVHSLVLLGSAWLAVLVAVAGLAGVAAVGAAYAMAREADAQLPRPDLDPVAPEPLAEPAAPQGFHVREARPGEVPPAYLAAVMKGAQARHAAMKALGGQP